MTLQALRLGLIGYPLEQSLSPVMHRAALRACQLAGDYTLLPIPPLPQGQDELAACLGRLRRGELDGLNVTLPHKQNVLSYLDELSPAVQHIGAANTLLCREGRLLGENTDAPGFLADLWACFPFLKNWPGHVLVLGAGGSARAVVAALGEAGWRVTLSGSRSGREQELQRIFPQVTAAFTSLEAALQAGAMAGVDLVVNTTPLGMFPALETTPWPEDLDFPDQAAVYDLVYKPRETRLVRQARQRGRPAANGLGMLVEQAALAFELWSGKTADRTQMRQAADAAQAQPAGDPG